MININTSIYFLLVTITWCTMCVLWNSVTGRLGIYHLHFTIKLSPSVSLCIFNVFPSHCYRCMYSFSFQPKFLNIQLSFFSLPRWQLLQGTMACFYNETSEYDLTIEPALKLDPSDIKRKLWEPHNAKFSFIARQERPSPHLISDWSTRGRSEVLMMLLTPALLCQKDIV